jgi:hypothetical protein
MVTPVGQADAGIASTSGSPKLQRNLHSILGFLYFLLIWVVVKKNWKGSSVSQELTEFSNRERKAFIEGVSSVIHLED